MAPNSRYSEISELQQSLKTKSLELAYAKTVCDTNEVIQEEEARLFRVRMLLLEHENDDLHEQLAEEDTRAVDLEKQLAGVQMQYMESTSNITLLKDALRSKIKEVDTLESELASLNVTSTKTTKLLTEKLALEHELASLKPEVEHLRSQAASYQATLSEKLSLQRELNTLQVELETEKRATQKLLAKQMEEAEQDAKYEAQVVKLRKELAKEKQDREQAERESERVLERSEERKNALENKLEAMREKLRTTKAQLKETQIELQQAKAAQEAAATRSVPLKDPEKPTKNPRKRKAVKVDLPETIGTPDEGTRQGRGKATQREKRVSTVPGDKSNFSITPFLNRTTSIAPDSPSNEQPDERNEEASLQNKEPEDEPAIETNTTPSVAPKKKRTKKSASATSTNKSSGKEVLTGIVAGRENAKASLAKGPALSQVIEENEENEPPEQHQESTAQVASTTENPAKSTTADSVVSDETSRIKKKRKLLGGGRNKTLFDEDEGESAARPLGKSLFGGGKGFPVLMSKSLGGNKGATTGPAAFSPLKKDRKAAVSAQ